MTVVIPSISEQDGESTALRRELLAALTIDLRVQQQRQDDARRFGHRLAGRVREVVRSCVRSVTTTDELTLRREATAIRPTGQLTALVEHADALEWLFERLADDHSRAQFVELIKARVTGRPAPLSAVRQQQLQDLAAFIDRTCRLESRTYGSLLQDLHRYQIDGASGPIDLRARRADLLRTFFVERYAYERDGSVVRAQQGQVVIDAESRWGDTALYFADRVGPSGEVHAIEPDVRCAAVIRENGYQNPHLGYQTVVSVRAVSDRVGEWRSYPADGPLRLLMRPESWEPSLASTPTISIDAYVEQQRMARLDFIKLDILGPGKALSGARAAVAMFRPALAIALSACLRDIIAIQPALEEIADGYDFFLDHVDCGGAGAVLFARPHVPQPRGQADGCLPKNVGRAASTEWADGA